MRPVSASKIELNTVKSRCSSFEKESARVKAPQCSRGFLRDVTHLMAQPASAHMEQRVQAVLLFIALLLPGEMLFT